jgi:hypothetical protein
MDLTTIEGAIALAQTIVGAIIANAPAIEADITASEPYVAALAGLIKGTNATQAEIDSLLALANSASATVQQPLPADDGTTST